MKHLILLLGMGMILAGCNESDCKTKTNSKADEVSCLSALQAQESASSSSTSSGFSSVRYCLGDVTTSMALSFEYQIGRYADGSRLVTCSLTTSETWSGISFYTAKEAVLAHDNCSLPHVAGGAYFEFVNTSSSSSVLLHSGTTGTYYAFGAGECTEN